MRAWVLTLVAAGGVVTALDAQGPSTIDRIPIVRGAKRDAKAEAQLLATSAAGARQLSVYRLPASIERIVKFYVDRLGATPSNTLDTVAAPTSDPTRVTYHLVFHSFDDECADSTPSTGTPPSGAPACARWRRGKDKKRALDGARVPYDMGRWIETATFTWWGRHSTGPLLRLGVVIKDIGLTDDWKHYMPLGQVIIESLEQPAAQ